MLRYKTDIISALKDKGYTQNIMTKKGMFGKQTVADMKKGKVVGIKSLDRLCNVLDCQLSDIVWHEKDDE